MAVMVACGVLVGVAMAAIVRWARLDLQPPGPAPVTRGDRVRRYVWWVQLWLLTAITSGVLVVGAGGRLAMRLLGATGGDTAQGRITEADEVVGEITVGGTIGFIVFVGLLVGFTSAFVYLALRRHLPARWLGGLAFGAGMLVVVGTRSDPLRPENRDFDLVGPWWLAVIVFTALALGHGLALASFSAAISRWLPLPGRNARSVSYLVLGSLIPVFPLGIAALVGGTAYVFAGDLLERARRVLVGPGGVRAARFALAAVVLVAAPGFVTAIGDLVGRGP